MERNFPQLLLPVAECSSPSSVLFKKCVLAGTAPAQPKCVLARTDPTHMAGVCDDNYTYPLTTIKTTH